MEGFVFLRLTGKGNNPPPSLCLCEVRVSGACISSILCHRKYSLFAEMTWDSVIYCRIVVRVKPAGVRRLSYRKGLHNEISSKLHALKMSVKPAECLFLRFFYI